jgi:8-oxo-dGTP pyrophosphatase MutT (NUDIX family)
MNQYPPGAGGHSTNNRPRSVYGSIIMSPGYRYLLVRGRKTGKWSFPKGHIEPNESPFTCAMRELYEETGVSLGTRKPVRERPARLKVGYYYGFEVEKEFRTEIRDTDEVTDVRWVTLDEMGMIPGNIDVSDFLRRNKIVPFQHRVQVSHVRHDVVHDDEVILTRDMLTL